MMFVYNRLIRPTFKVDGTDTVRHFYSSLQGLLNLLYPDTYANPTVREVINRGIKVTYNPKGDVLRFTSF